VHCPASPLLKLLGQLLRLLVFILLVENSNLEAATATAQLSVSARVVSSCSITKSSTENAVPSQGTDRVDANVILSCSRAFNALIGPDSGGTTAGKASIGENGVVTYTISDMPGVSHNTKTLSINF